MLSPLAATLAPKEDLVNVALLISAYYEKKMKYEGVLYIGKDTHE